jgi:DNA repair exonuclease SbcCD nuclease subunit
MSETMRPYAIISDTHNHAWSAFSTVGHDGVNSRLLAILNEFGRCAKVLKEAGGDTIFHAGDLFHVRGSVAPTVLNPTREVMEAISRSCGIKWKVMPGNHDMELKVASKVGDSVQAVAGEHCQVIHSPTMFDIAETGFKDGAQNNLVMMVPWIADLEALKKYLTDCHPNREHKTKMDCIIHAPVDGVITGIPDHGLSPTFLAGLGFKRVFAGHYHNHVSFGTGVYSIGAIAHHTWSDVGSRAGFLIVHPDRVDWHASHAPSFVDIDPTMDEADIKCIVDGNFVRARIVASSTSKNINELRDMLMGMGAKGVSLMAVKAPTRARAATSTVTAGSSLEVSVANYIQGKAFPDTAQVVARCQKVLAEAAVL